MSQHKCTIVGCDGTKLGHYLAKEFPQETAQIDEALDRILRPDDYLKAPEEE